MIKKKFEDLSTKYGSVTMSIFESTWKNDQKTITVRVEDTPEMDAAVIGISRRMIVNRSDDLYCKRNQVRSRLREAVEEVLKENYKQPSLQELFDSRELSEWYCLCPPTWQGRRTKDANLGYFARHALEPISDAIKEDRFGPDVVKRVANEILEDVQKNQLKRRGKEDADGEESEKAAVGDTAKALANQHIRDCNAIFESLRRELENPDAIPYILLPLYDNVKVIPPEQCKALDRETLIKTAALLRLSVQDNPLSMGGVLMMTALVRTAEAVCPKFGEILILGNFAVYGVIWQSDGTARIADLKTDSAYRLVILPYYAVTCLKMRRVMLQKQGYSEAEINEMYVVCNRDDPYRPANPSKLSAYLRKVLSLAGCSEEFWSAAKDLMDTEPDPVPDYARHPELTAYVLRRSGCSYLCNCSGMDPRLVDTMMGHLLRRQDTDIADQIKDEDMWAKIADYLECIVYDPQYSANPAYRASNLLPKVPHQRVQIRITEDMIKNGKVTLSVETARADDILLTVPADVTDADYALASLRNQRIRFPSINELVDEAVYARCIETAKKIYDDYSEVFCRG